MAMHPGQAEHHNGGLLPGGCLVLAPPGDPPPTALLNAFAQRGLPVRMVHDEPSVMTMFAERSAGRRVLVVVEPGRWERLAELICAVHGFHGEVLCWQFAENGTGRAHLSRLDQRCPGPDTDAHATLREGYAPAGHAAAEDEGPIGAIRRRRRQVDMLLTRVPGQPLSTREVVTQQELTMLLGPAPGEAG